MDSHENLEKDEEFKQFMQEVARIEGERLLRENERLLADPTAAVPAALDARCRELILNAFRSPSPDDDA